MKKILNRKNIFLIIATILLVLFIINRFYTERINSLEKVQDDRLEFQNSSLISLYSIDGISIYLDRVTETDIQFYIVNKTENKINDVDLTELEINENPVMVDICMAGIMPGYTKKCDFVYDKAIELKDEYATSIKGKLIIRGTNMYNYYLLNEQIE